MQLIDMIMKPNGQKLLAEFSKQGRYYFNEKEAQKFLHSSHVATLATLRRLKLKGSLATIVEGFNVIVPPQHHDLGCIPPAEFIHELMRFLKTPYYVGLLSAAQYHGAAHQKPQIYQVMVPKARRPLQCGRVRLRFYGRHNLDQVPTQVLRSRTGDFFVSTPEATAIDLCSYPKGAAGWENVATVLHELHEAIDPKILRKLLPVLADTTTIQRMGYLFDRVIGNRVIASLLIDYVRKHTDQIMPLVPGLSKKDAPVDRKWMLYINEKIESDL